MDTSWADFRLQVERTFDARELLRQAKHAFHVLWGMHKCGMPYDKNCWIALQLALTRLGIRI